MLISELQAQLEAIKQEHGDLEISIDTNYDTIWKKADGLKVIKEEIFYPIKSFVKFVRFW